MTPSPSPPSDVQKPRALTDKEWQELLHAANSRWFSYVFDLKWLVSTPAALFAGMFVVNIVHSHGDVSAAVIGVFYSDIFTWVLVFSLLFRIIFYSIDYAGKRKLARQINLIAAPDKL